MRGQLPRAGAAMRIALAFCLAPVLTDCGYRLVGKGGSFPEGVEKVAVVGFKNKTDRYGLESEASSAFIQELMATGKVKVSPKDEADAWFEGTLTAYNTIPIAYTAQRVITERRLTITAKLEFFLKNQEKPFFFEDGLTGRADYQVTENLVRNSEAEKEAVTKALTDLAGKVISRIVEGF